MGIILLKNTSELLPIRSIVIITHFARQRKSGFSQKIAGPGGVPGRRAKKKPKEQ
jgi:hypothetical protein